MKSCQLCVHAKVQACDPPLGHERELLCTSPEQRAGRLRKLACINGGVHLMFYSRSKIVQQDQERLMLEIASECKSFSRAEHEARP